MGTVTNPLGGLLRGMLMGQEMGLRIKHQAMQEEAHQRNIAAADHESQVRDIQTRMMLDQNARPVNAGTVADQLPAAPVPRPDGEMGPVAANLFPDMQGGEPQIPTVRPVDKSRRVSYKGRDGQSQDYELYTPEEQMARKVKDTEALKHADAVPIKTPQHLRDIGMPETIWVPNDHLTQYAETTGQMAPVDTPAAYQEMGGPAKVPQRNYSAVTSTMNAAANRTAADKRATDATTSREKIAGENRTAANTRAADANASRERAASTRGNRPTANAEGVQNRFQQRQLETDQKELRGLETKEAALHAQKLETGQMNPGAKDDAKAFVNSRNAKLSALDLQIKAIQESKKKLIDKWQGKGGTPQQAAPSPAQARPRATNPQTGEVVEFDGKQWVKTTGN